MPPVGKVVSPGLYLGHPLGNALGKAILWSNKMSIVNRAIDCIFQIESTGLDGASPTIQGLDYTMIRLHQAWIAIENNNQLVAWVLMDPYTFQQHQLNQDFINFFDQETHKEILKTGIVGVLWGAYVVVTDSICPGVCYVLSERAPNTRPLEDRQFQCIRFPTPPKKKVLDLGAFVKVREHTRWLLLKQPKTNSEKWVSKNDIQVADVDIAFYDADPTWVPPGV